jgi:hypothetical protein
MMPEQHSKTHMVSSYEIKKNDLKNEDPSLKAKHGNSDERD